MVVLLAVRTLRRALDDAALRQTHQIKRLVETVALLNQQQQKAQVKIQGLVEANRRLGDEVTALYERVGESDGGGRPSGASRLLN